MTKIYIEKEIASINVEGMLVSDIAKLYLIYPGYTNLRIKTPDGVYGDDPCYYLFGDRLETDKEYEKRLESAAKEEENRKKRAQAALDKEKAEYLRLKKKFE